MSDTTEVPSIHSSDSHQTMVPTATNMSIKDSRSVFSKAWGKATFTPDNQKIAANLVNWSQMGTIESQITTVVLDYYEKKSRGFPAMQTEIGYKPIRPETSTTFRPTKMPLGRIVRVINDNTLSGTLLESMRTIDGRISLYKNGRAGGSAHIADVLPQSSEFRHPLNWKEVSKLRDSVVSGVEEFIAKCEASSSVEGTSVGAGSVSGQ